MGQNTEKKYTYAVLHRNQKKIIKSTEPPLGFQESLREVLNLLGTEEPDRYIEVYIRRGTVWQPVMGAESDHPQLFLMPPQWRPLQMDEEELDLLGRSLIKAYKETRRLLRASKRKLKNGKVNRANVENDIGKFEHNISILEAAMEDTGFGEYYQLWLKQNFTNSACAQHTHMSPRQWARVVENLRVQIANSIVRMQPQFVIESVLDVVTNSVKSLDIMEGNEDAE